MNHWELNDVGGPHYNPPNISTYIACTCVHTGAASFGKTCQEADGSKDGLCTLACAISATLPHRSGRLLLTPIVPPTRFRFSRSSLISQYIDIEFVLHVFHALFITIYRRRMCIYPPLLTPPWASVCIGFIDLRAGWHWFASVWGNGCHWFVLVSFLCFTVLYSPWVQDLSG